MAARNSSSGFTLVEVMIASSISVLVFGTIISTFLFCQRQFRSTMADAEMTLALRDVRDKLLFRAGPGLNEGLLTGMVSTNGSAIAMRWSTDQNGFGNGPEKISILLKHDNIGNYFFNEKLEGTDANDRWFCPNDFRQFGDWKATVDLPRIQIDLGSTKANDVRGKTWILLPQ